MKIQVDPTDAVVGPVSETAYAGSGSKGLNGLLKGIYNLLAGALTVSFGTSGRSVSATFTPAAAAYSAGDVMDVAKVFTNIGSEAGGEFFITSTILEIAHTALVSGETSYTLEVYNAAPPSAHADNAVWDIPSGDRAAHVCSIPLGTPVDKGSTLKVRQDGLNMQVTIPAGGDLYAELVTNGACTPTAAARTVTLKTIPV